MPAGDSRRQIVGAAAPPGAMTVRSTAYCSGVSGCPGRRHGCITGRPGTGGELAVASGGTAPETPSESSIEGVGF